MPENLPIEILSRHLSNFEFRQLFNELGWSNPANDREVEFYVSDKKFTRKEISQLSGATVFEIASANGAIPDKNLRKKIEDEIIKLHRENVLIFVDGSRTNSLWYWTKFEDKKKYPREHLYIKGQPVDLMLGKITAMNFDISEFDDEGNVPIVAVANKLQQALDVEKVTKKFYGEFQTFHLEFIEFIKGIENERDKQWYASVILNRLMFIYFLQKKFFIDNNQNYLQDKLAASKAKGNNLFYTEFLDKLFFVGFAKPEYDRKPEEKSLLGDVPFLNGGLFLPHKIELDENNDIQIADEAFENLFALFGRYSWHLDDTPSGKPNEINPDVLGYIFEKYINQKAFGAYYTRPEITGYLCEQTIYKLILDKVNALAKPADGTTPNMFSSNDGGLFLSRTYGSISDLLLNLDDNLCEKLWHDILPGLKLLDPACGSGAFLVAALKTLLNVYSAVIGKIEILGGSLKDELDQIRKEHAFNYFLKKRIITDNLFGVDIMEEATEIAKLRLFMTLVSSVSDRRRLEPLPNIDFNILAGNSLIGILKVDEKAFDKVNALGETQSHLFSDTPANEYKKILEDKELSIKLYKEHSFKSEKDESGSQDTRLLVLRSHIEKLRRDSYEKLNELLLGDFKDLKIKFEQATWDEKQNKIGKPEKRELTKADIEELQPFHWEFEFPKVFKNGGFDAIIANPPWEVFKPNAKEFFEQHEELISKEKGEEAEKIFYKKKMAIEAFKKESGKILKNNIQIRELWLEYINHFPHVSLYYRSTPQYKNQISVVNGKKQGSDINLYKLFLEQCFNLLRDGGACGIIVQSGIYTDLGAKQLREMLFDNSRINSLFGLSNEKFIFENVHHAQKFCILTFYKGEKTDKFEAAFRINPREAIKPDKIGEFLNSDKEHLKISVSLIKRLSPDSISIMEFKNKTDVQIAEKLLKFPLLSEESENKWNLSLTREFDMTNDSHLFKTSSGKDRLPLHEGKMIHQFTDTFSEGRYWIDKKEGRASILGRNEDNGQTLDYQDYRLGIRAVASNVNTNSLICSALPPNVFCGNSILTSRGVEGETLIYCVALFNSFVVDWMIRNKVSQNINMFYVYQLPIPRLTKEDTEFLPIVERATKLICTTPEFDDLAKEVGLESHKNGVTDESERQMLRAELDALVAHLYELTEEEFEYILTTFPLVSDAVKTETLEAFRTFAPHPDDRQLLEQIKEGEKPFIEFKIAACWNAKTGKKDDAMRLKISEEATAFLNSTDGGAILIGIEDGTNRIVGIAEDIKTANPQKQDKDGYERFLVDTIRHNCGLTDFSSVCELTFHNLEGKDICRILVKPSPKPVYHQGRDFIIRDGTGMKKLSTPEAIEYIAKRWK